MSTALNGSLVRALEILDVFSADLPVLTAKTVAERLDMSLPTAHRFLLTLEHTGHLVSPRRGQFTLGQKLEELGRLASEISPLPSLARPVVDRISRELDESVMACRLGRQGALCIATANSRRPIRVSVDLGTVLPLRTTAQGKLFLADLPPEERQARARAEADAAGQSFGAEDSAALERMAHEVATQGFATNTGENESEIAALARPVRDPSGRVILTLSVFCILSRFDTTLAQAAQTALKAGVDSLSARLCARGQDRLSHPKAASVERHGIDQSAMTDAAQTEKDPAS